MNNTQLKDRILWYDGDFTIKSGEILDFITKYGHIPGLCVDELTSDIKSYNHFLSPSEQIHIKHELNPLILDWNIPEYYKSLNLYDYILDKFYTIIDGYDLNSQYVTDRINRILLELKMFQQYNMDSLLRVVIYIVDIFKTNNIVWGVGRGSSVSSYILYIIGIHDVDSVEYDLDIRDFLHD